MIGSLIGAGLGIAGSIFGGISASKAAREAKAKLEAQQRDNQNWFDRRYNEQATQRADARRMLSIVEENIRRRNRHAQGTSAVMGSSPEAVALAQEGGNQALSQTAGNIVAQGEARKDAIEGQYLERKNAIDGQLINLEQQRAQNVAQATSGVLQAAGGIASGLDGLGGASKAGANAPKHYSALDIKPGGFDQYTSLSKLK